MKRTISTHRDALILGETLIQTIVSVNSFPLGWLASKKQKLASAGKHIEKLGSLCTAEGKKNGAATVHTTTVVPRKLKHRITVSSSNFPSGYISKDLEIGSQRDICTPIFIAALFQNGESMEGS